ncbi:MAG: AI-2E family transporter [Aridibacter sp.]
MLKAENNKPTFTKKVLIITGIAILSVSLILLAYSAIDVMFSLFAAILLAVFFRGLGNWISHYTKISEGLAVVLVCVVLLGILSLGIWLLAPEVEQQIIELKEFFPAALDSLRLRLAQYNWGRLVLGQIPAWEGIFNQFVSSRVLTRIGGFFSTTFGVVANLVVILLLAIYLASEPQTYTNGLIKLFPISKRARMREVVGEIGDTLRWWLVGKFFSMLIIGVLTAVGLWILGVPLALSLGIFAALLTFIPNFGPIIAVIPAALFALVESPTKALYVLALYLGIQMVESYLITPLIDRKTISLPPVLTIFFQIFLGVLVGGLGLILATPLLAVLIVLVKMLYIEDILGDSDVVLPSEAVEEKAED